MPNRLAGQTSPYLLQHANNPVAWHPWGPEAIAEARQRNVPIFLSIGYSTCYWCHVMERESFEDAEIGEQMSRDFVCIKVDREERPDLDDAYMAATQIMTGRGGWPMSVFLEPTELKPFWCGAYFPKVAKPGMGIPTFPTVLDSIADAWRDQHDEVMAQAQQLGDAVRDHLGEAGSTVPLHAGHVREAAGALLQLVDPPEGGFGNAPKFPQVVYLDFLFDIRERADDATRGAIDTALRLTLDRMAVGGIHDQVGGGFHRYSVDAHWTVPHFEKMLYDQAQLAIVYARGAVVFGDSYYEHVARRTLAYVEREMLDQAGMFFSAQDAEVDHREGLNYVWTAEQFRQALADSPDHDWAAEVFGITNGPNFQDPHHPDDPPVNVLRLVARPEQVADERGEDAGEFLARLDRVSSALLAVRNGRDQPHLDDKSITAWNGMMIEAFARCGEMFNDERLLAIAARAASAVLDMHTTETGSLARVSRRGSIGGPGFLDDHAHMLVALLALDRARDTSRSWREDAVRLAAVIQRDFGAPGGGCFDVPAARVDLPDALFVRTRTTYDGATPSGQGVLLSGLLGLAERTGEGQFLKRGADLLSSMSASIASSPVSTINATRSAAAMLGIEALRDRPGLFGDDVPDAETRDAARESPVQVYAGVERVDLKRSEPADLELLIKIQPGHHIIAAEPGDEAPAGLIPLRVWTHGGAGVEAFVDYPVGTPMDVPDVGGVMVHEGDLELRVVLERTGEWSGRPMLMVAYQACSETACDQPVTVELDVALDPAK